MAPAWYALAVYLGSAPGELEALEWGDLDLEHGKVTVHRCIDRDEQNGDDDTTASRRRPSAPSASSRTLAPVAPGDARRVGRSRGDLLVFPAPVISPNIYVVYLRVALVTASRPLHHRRDPDQPPLSRSARVDRHLDGGARRRSREIWQRVGHEDWETMRKYMRVAEVLVEGFGDVFPPLPTIQLSAPPHICQRNVRRLAKLHRNRSAGRTGLEPAASGVTGRRYNQLNYRPNR